MASVDYRRSRNKHGGGIPWHHRKLNNQGSIKCSECGSSESSIWKRVPVICDDDVPIDNGSETDTSADSGSRNSRIICQRCHGRLTALSRKLTGKTEVDPKLMRSVSAMDSINRSRSNTPDSSAAGVNLRRASARAIRQPQTSLPSQSVRNESPAPILQSKSNRFVSGNRRSALFKGRRGLVEKGPPNKASIRTCAQMWKEDRLYRVGDVVSMQDTLDLQLYYAQIRGLIIDEYCNKYAVLTWLLPSHSAPKDGSFLEETFIPGLVDEKFYSLDCLQFEISPTAQHLVPKWSVQRCTLNKD